MPVAPECSRSSLVFFFFRHWEFLAVTFLWLVGTSWGIIGLFSKYCRQLFSFLGLVGPLRSLAKSLFYATSFDSRISSSCMNISPNETFFFRSLPV